jgi:hypothetical protein
VNRYLPPRPRRDGSNPNAATPATATEEKPDAEKLPPLLRWLDKALSR